MKLAGMLNWVYEQKITGKVIFVKELKVLTSPRRWKKGSFKEFQKYSQAYFSTIWFGKPPKSKLQPVR